MKSALLAPLIVAVVLAQPLTCAARKKPVKSPTPLSADELAIYTAVLREYSHGQDTSLNVSRNTYPLDPASPMNGLQQSGCLDGIQLENLQAASSSFHRLPPEVLPDKSMKLVDPGKQTKIVHTKDPSRTIREGKQVNDAVQDAFFAALFSMSEIAFDKEHRFAVVAYTFWCGSLCGNGSTLVFEKVNGRWRNAKRGCAGWVS